MAARRRRTRGTWFPTIGSTVDGGEENLAGRQFSVTGVDIIQTVGIFPLTFDTPFEGETIEPGVDSLADIIGSEYILQRIVGKIHICRQPVLSTIPVGADNEPAVLVGCGFFVARANDAAVGGGADTPIGSATAQERRDHYSPIELDTIREPWIWRRTWVLGNGPTQLASGGNGSVGNSVTRAFPPSTALYGSVADGGHIDSRIKRRVSQDDRLWFAVAAITWPIGQEPILGVSLAGYLDFRIFGSLRKAKNSSAF